MADRRARRPGSAPQRVATVLADVLKRRGVAGAVREQRLVTEWHDIVGDRVAARAWPDGLRGGVLFVRVTNSAWLHELGFLKEAIVERANRVAGAPSLVREVRLHLGERRVVGPDDVVAELAAKQRRARPAPPPRPPLPASTVALIDHATEKVAHAELREAIRDAWRKLAAR